MITESIFQFAYSIASANLGIQLSASIAFGLIAWRCWRFLVVPLLWPQEPRLLPYWIPFVGHTWSFVRNPEALINNGFHYFGSNSPFSLTVAGKRTIIVRDMQDVQAMWRNTKALSFDPFVVDVMGSFGITKSTLVKIFQDPNELVAESDREKSLLCTTNPQRKGYMNLEREWFKTQLLEPQALRRIELKYLTYLEQVLQPNSLKGRYIKSRSNDGSLVISLKQYCKHVVTYCSTNTFFGVGLEEAAPSFIRDYQDFEDESWKIFYRFPPFLVKSAHRFKNQAIDGIEKYLAQNGTQRNDAEWLFKTMHSELQYIGIPPRDIAGIFMVIIWAINNNAHKIGFWVLAHILYTPDLLGSIKSEIGASYALSKSIPDIDVLVSSCPTLDAVWNEALRMYNASSAVRQATQPCVIGGKYVRVGDQLIAPFRQFHLNKEIFGDNAATFRGDRFLGTKGLQRAKGFAPFGGGHTYCPGRQFAQREIFMFIAQTLHTFDMELEAADASANVPNIDLETPSAAAMSPDRDILVRIKAEI